ncbi:MAG: sigma-70 family RNA polymerase sigma factor [Ardenticatenaceae bacterium]|nr:sigma-70 family RNA polymerase sigma factor [Ardenticatenaceae bacterium]MCB9444608.1 sigma-70 family RNA polymerase sigma factor [Ardenticatenaceae bacterium]
MKDIQAVVSQCQEGHLDAFTTLFNRCQNRVYDVACAILRNEAAAEDAVQDTFLVVFQKINSYKGESAFETWLIAITVNQCRMRLRRQKVRQFLSLERLSRDRLFSLSSSGSGSSEGVADTVHQRQRRQTLWDLVDRLDDRLRLPLILRYRYALSCGEIADILDRRQSTIYQHLHEGRKLLEQMARQEEAETLAPSIEAAS